MRDISPIIPDLHSFCADTLVDAFEIFKLRGIHTASLPGALWLLEESQGEQPLHATKLQSRFFRWGCASIEDTEIMILLTSSSATMAVKRKYAALHKTVPTP